MTVVETALFSKLWPDYWAEDERGEFATWLANHPDAGDVIPGSGGCRKVRWARAGMGKRGGVRVIYYAQTARGRLYLLMIYAKSARDNFPTEVLRKIREELDNAEN
ncbi:transcriptional regulator [Sinimarinibacterium sp. CAU 1509]|nr:transcriptional regulator [Sinimarinibacterium sp. CAU 1509]